MFAGPPDVTSAEDSSRRGTGACGSENGTPPVLHAVPDWWAVLDALRTETSSQPVTQP